MMKLRCERVADKDLRNDHGTVASERGVLSGDYASSGVPLDEFAAPFDTEIGTVQYLALRLELE